MSCEFLPEDGGRLVSLKSKAAGREYIWINERTKNLKRYYGANYDNLMAGGVEEAFPTGYEDGFEGNAIPFFGEIWPIAWEVTKQEKDYISMLCYSSIFPVIIHKTYSLNGPDLECHYSIKNLSNSPIPLMFGVHPSIAVKKGDRINIAPGDYRIGLSEGMPDGCEAGKSFTWPVCGKENLSVVPEIDKEDRCMEFSTDKLNRGFFSLEDDSENLNIRFDEKVFTALSLWYIWGGWRGHRCLMFEFYTGYPFKLSEAVKKESIPYLKAKDSFETSVIYKLSRPVNTV